MGIRCRTLLGTDPSPVTLAEKICRVLQVLVPEGAGSSVNRMLQISAA
jgi:hypothetical protein